MQGRSPQLSMELNSECVAKRGDGSEQDKALRWQQMACLHSQSIPSLGIPKMSPTGGQQTLRVVLIWFDLATSGA